MSNSSLAASCLAVGLVSAWAPVAEADVLSEVHYDAHLSADLSNVLLLFSAPGSGTSGYGHAFAISSLPGLGSGSLGTEFAASDFGNAFAMMALRGGTGSGGPGLHLVLSRWVSPTLIPTFSPFESEFPGISEGALIDSLASGTPLAADFLAAHFDLLHVNNGSGASMLSYSDPVVIGTITVNVVSVPGPGVLPALSLPLALLGRRRRR